MSTFEDYLMVTQSVRQGIDMNGKVETAVLAAASRLEKEDGFRQRGAQRRKCARVQLLRHPG